MKLHYLGTAAAEAIPAVWCNCEVCKKIRKTRGKDVRTRSQVLINDDLMVDFPQDSYMHMLQNDLEFYKLKYVIFTHSHQDHFYPEEFAMRSEGYAAGIEEPVHVYALTPTLPDTEFLPQEPQPSVNDGSILKLYKSPIPPWLDGWLIKTLQEGIFLA